MSCFSSSCASQSEEKAKLKKFHSDDREEIDNRRNLLPCYARCLFCEMGFNSFRIHVLMQLRKTSFNFSLKCQRNEFETQLRSKSLLMHEATDNHSELKLLIILACKL